MPKYGQASNVWTITWFPPPKIFGRFFPKKIHFFGKIQQKFLEAWINLVSLKNFDIWPHYGPAIPYMPICRHTFFGHNSASFGLIGLLILWEFRRLLSSDELWEILFIILDFFTTLAEEWVWPPGKSLIAWGLKTQPKSWVGLLVLNQLLFRKCVFKIFGLEPPSPLQQIKTKIIVKTVFMLYPGHDIQSFNILIRITFQKINQKRFCIVPQND